MREFFVYTKLLDMFMKRIKHLRRFLFPISLLCCTTLFSIVLTSNPATVFAGITQFTDDFERSNIWDWSFTGGAGSDYGKNLAHRGQGNLWVRNTTGWNAVNKELSPSAPTGSLCTAQAWLRTSETLTDGYMSVRQTNSDGSVGNVIKELKLGASPVNSDNKNYNFYTFDFYRPVSNSILFYVGLWGNGQDSWIQIDDVAISCRTPY